MRIGRPAHQIERFTMQQMQINKYAIISIAMELLPPQELLKICQ